MSRILCRWMQSMITLLLAAVLLVAVVPTTTPLTRSIPTAHAADDEPFTSVWSAPIGIAESVAWGDYDNDGDLDLATTTRLYRNDDGMLMDWAIWSGSGSTSVAWGDIDDDGDLDLIADDQMYRNDKGTLTSDAVWKAQDTNRDSSVALGDYDGDGDLDLVVGNWEYPTRLYRNDNGTLTSNAVWETQETDWTNRVALGDMDSDGDLDLVVANECFIGDCHPNRLYRNDNGTFTTSAVWESTDGGGEDIALGDMDNDGDLDFAAAGGYGIPNRIYRNNAGTLTTSAIWESDPEDVDEYGNPAHDMTTSIAWGDYDGDGDLDLATGNHAGPNRIYRNDAGTLTTTSVWSSPAEHVKSDGSLTHDNTLSIAWGDYDGDGDLDLLAGSNWWFDESRLYRNNAGMFTSNAVWTATDSTSLIIALGDYDSDGDLDLAAGSNFGPNRLYRNDGGTLTTSAVWESDPEGIDGSGNPDYDNPRSIAWGDVDSDGDLDLAVGYNNLGSPAVNRLYRNDGGTLTTHSVWSAQDADYTDDVAWGDYDGDGDLDLAVGNYGFLDEGEANTLHRNDNGILTEDTVWIPTPEGWTDGGATWHDMTRSITWGDVDNDGDLDLIAGNAGYSSNGNIPSRLYHNDNGVLNSSGSWIPAPESPNYGEPGYDSTSGVAFGDVDGDGDLDLATDQRLYRNDDGVLNERSIWSSSGGMDAAWGDYDGDGDLDLTVAGQYGIHNRLYRNNNGVLTSNPVWSADDDNFGMVAWGDVDGDGDLDLMIGTYMYRNLRNAQSVFPIPTISIASPAPADNAAAFSSGHIWDEPAITFNYTLKHQSSLPVREMRAFYSLNGGGQWFPAIPTENTQTTNLATSPDGTTHTFTWDTFASGFMGQSDNVVFRIEALPDHHIATGTAGPYQYGRFASDTLPFRVRGTQVRVLDTTGAPVKGALVYRIPHSQSTGGTLLTDDADDPLTTDHLGYLRGRSELAIGDQLLALRPVQIGEDYTLYHTSGVPGFTMTEPGVQQLTVSAENPLILFDLTISLEWDARSDTRFLNQLEHDLQRASAHLYDWSDGQVALGHVQVYHDLDYWEDAHVRIYATDRLRPNADQGGIASATDADHDDITYTAGQVRIGATWTQYGNASSDAEEDWPRTLAHELSRMLLYLDTNAMALDDGLLVPYDGCPSAMSDPYRDDYTEFHPAQEWAEQCAGTLSDSATGRSDWETITTFYPALYAPESFNANPGPSLLAFNLTEVEMVEPATHASDLLSVPSCSLLDDAGNRTTVGPDARAFLFDSSGDYVTSLGNPTGDQVHARGAAVGDRLCVYALTEQRLGCEEVTAGDLHLHLHAQSDWQPDVIIAPIDAHTIAVTVTNMASSLNLQAELYPENNPATDPDLLQPGEEPAPPTYHIALFKEGGIYRGTFALVEPAMAGRIHIWVPDSDNGIPDLSLVAEYGLGGNPGPNQAEAYGQRQDSRRRSDGERRSWLRRLSQRAPLVAPDGQVILSGNSLTFAEDDLYAVQPVTLPPAELPWTTRVGAAYRLLASPNAPDLNQTALSIAYLENEVPTGEEAGLWIYFWNGTTWQQLDTVLDRERNIASARSQGPGIYTLLATTHIRLFGPGWNDVGYPIRGTRSVSDALQSIEDVYTSIWYHQEDPDEPDLPAWHTWWGYHNGAPAWVNDLEHLEFGKGYNIYVTRDADLYLKGAAEALPDNEATARVGRARVDDASIPAVYYGAVQASDGFTPEPGMPVQAWMNDTLCGEGETLEQDGQVVYVITVVAAGCGAPGDTVRFTIDGQPMAPTPPWENTQANALDLGIAPLLTLVSDAVVVSEADGSATVEVQLNTTSAHTVTVEYATTDQTAVADEDYAATSGTLTFAPGTITQTVAIPITDDQAGEADEVFRLTLHDPINAALETPDTALVTIVDDDTTPQVQFSAPHSSVREDDGSVPVTVTLSIAAPLTVTGDVVSRDGSATTGSDYTAVDETLTFAPGEVEQVVTVAVTDDDEAEEDETVTLRLRDAVNGSPGPQATHTLIIQDDETAVSGDPTGFPGIQFSADAYTVHEAAGTAAVTVTLSKAATQPVTVMCTSADGSATADQDYTPVDVLLTFAPGEMQQTVAVAITDDDAEEADETLMLTLHDTVNATLGIPAEATVTIASDDGRPASGPRPVYLPIVQRGTFDE